MFIQKMGRVELKGRDLEEEWEEMEGRIRKAIKEMEMELGKKTRKKRG